MLYPDTLLNLIRGFQSIEAFPIKYIFEWAIQEIEKGCDYESVSVLASLSEKDIISYETEHIICVLEDFNTFQFDRETSIRQFIYFHIERIKECQNFECILPYLDVIMEYYLDDSLELGLHDFALAKWHYKDLISECPGMYLDIKNVEELKTFVKVACEAWIDDKIWN